jgi:hypothetical protein
MRQRIDHDEVWDRYQRGELPTHAARAMGRSEHTVFQLIYQQGGIRPAKRWRAAGRLSLEEREEISRGLAAGESFRAIAGRLQRVASTVSREVNAHGGRDGYRAATADQAAWAAAKRPKVSRLAERDELRDAVEQKLRLRGSPVQIAGWLRLEHPDDPSVVGVARDFSTGRCSCRPKVA